MAGAYLSYNCHDFNKHTTICPKEDLSFRRGRYLSFYGVLLCISDVSLG